MPKNTFAPIDLYLACTNRDTLAADLAPLDMGLVRPTLTPAYGHPSPIGRVAGGEGASASELVTSAHAPDGTGHALDYAGKLPKNPSAGRARSPSAPPPEMSEIASSALASDLWPLSSGSTPPLLPRALRRLLPRAQRADPPPPAAQSALRTPHSAIPEYYPREHANLRLYGPAAETRAEKIRSANFRCGTVVLPPPATPSRRWA